jgi:phage replication initiation protein
MHSTDSPFTLTIDWLAFTLPVRVPHDTMLLLGGDWTKSEHGFRGYPSSWMTAGANRGIGKLGIGAPRAPREMHVDLSAGIVASWSSEKVRTVLQWILSHDGHFTRLDCALDDRASSVPLATILHAIKTGQCVTRAELMQRIESGSIHTGTPSGATIYLGSRRSQTLLRIYDKRLERQAKGHEDWQEYGIRWELELKKDRAHVSGQVLSHLEEADWIGFVVGVFRSHVDFRDTNREESDANRCQAPLLDWWLLLTEGFQKARLVVEKEDQTLAQVKLWLSQSIAPMLALCVAQPGGQAWLAQVLVVGKSRWKDKHRRLLATLQPERSVSNNLGNDADIPFQEGERVSQGSPFLP